MNYGNNRLIGDLCSHARSTFERSEYRGLLEILANDVGPRYPGGPSIAKARTLISKELRNVGLFRVYEQEETVDIWRPGEPVFEVVSPWRKSYGALECVFSGSGDVTLPLAYLGPDEIDELEPTKRRLDGVAVLMDSSFMSGGTYTPCGEVVKRLKESGARGAIFASAQRTGLPALEVAFRSGDSIPCMCVSNAVGEELKSELGRRLQVRMRCSGTSSTGVCANLIGEMGASASTEEVIILGAHLDTFTISPGVFDNLIGVATVVEIARLLAPFSDHFRRTLRIVFYTAEEFYFLGSRRYVARCRNDLHRIKFVVNMDGIFSGTANGMAVMWSAEMSEYIRRVFSERGITMDIRDMFCMTSDYLPFMLGGVPAARPAYFGGHYPMWLHTEQDVLDNVDPEWVEQNASAYAPLIAHLLADSRPLPVRRLEAGEVRQLLEREGVLKTIVDEGFTDL